MFLRNYAMFCDFNIVKVAKLLGRMGELTALPHTSRKAPPPLVSSTLIVSRTPPISRPAYGPEKTRCLSVLYSIQLYFAFQISLPEPHSSPSKKTYRILSRITKNLIRTSFLIRKRVRNNKRRKILQPYKIPTRFLQETYRNV